MSQAVSVPFEAQPREHRAHVVQFYSQDSFLLDELTRFIGTALVNGDVAVVVATSSHREELANRLLSRGFDLSRAMQWGRYVPLDAADTLSAFMREGMPDPVAFAKLLGSLIVTVSKAATVKQARVAIFGECVHILWAQGNAEAAIRMEKLGNQLAKTYNVDILCGYSLGSVQGVMESHIFQQICEEHSAVHSR